MESIVEAAVAAKRENVEKRVWAGYGVTALVTLFMAFDGISKMAVERHVVQSMTELGWPPDQTVSLGILVLGCTALYVIPQTSMLGAILLTGFLGGATAAKARVESPALLFAVAFGVLVWLGAYLRDERLRELVPFTRTEAPTEGSRLE